MDIENFVLNVMLKFIKYMYFKSCSICRENVGNNLIISL